MTGKTVKVLFYNSQATARSPRRSRPSPGPAASRSSETIPTDDKDFQTWQTRQARAVLTALGG